MKTSDGRTYVIELTAQLLIKKTNLSMNGVEQGLANRRINDRLVETKQRFQKLIQTSEQVGDGR